MLHVPKWPKNKKSKNYSGKKIDLGEEGKLVVIIKLAIR
jgi:hypothetical protein